MQLQEAISPRFVICNIEIIYKHLENKKRSYSLASISLITRLEKFIESSANVFWVEDRSHEGLVPFPPVLLSPNILLWYGTWNVIDRDVGGLEFGPPEGSVLFLHGEKGERVTVIEA